MRIRDRGHGGLGNMRLRRAENAVRSEFGGRGFQRAIPGRFAVGWHIEKVARNLFILIFDATIAALLGRGYYNSLQSGVIRTVKGYTAHRDREPIKYWAGMLIGIFAFLVAASGTVLMAFLICVDLFGH